MRSALRTLLVAVAGTAWVSLFWLRPPRTWPAALGAPRRALLDAVASVTGLPGSWAWVLVSLVLGGLLPALLLVAIARPTAPSLLGGGRRAGWHLAGVAYVGALPFLLWLAARQSFRDYYVPMLQGGLWGPALRFVLVIAAEHVCIQGAVLRLALGATPPWPAEPAVDGSARGWRRVPGLFGLGAGPGLTARLGVDGRALLALAAQAWVFGWVHLSKDVGELALSFPGGLALGYLALRSRSVWPCVALHALTGLSVIGLAMALYGLPAGR